MKTKNNKKQDIHKTKMNILFKLNIYTSKMLKH